MRFSYNWLQSFFKDKLPKPEELTELLTMKSFEVEEVAKKEGDWILDVDILPNRASDCLSHYGLAREIAGVTEAKLSRKVLSARPPKADGQKSLSIEVSGASLCPRYSAYVIEGVKISESADWIKERLAAMDQKTINNIVDITNYVMWELGQPLHAFDFDKIQGAKMNIRLAKQSEKLKTLDGTEHDLGDDFIIIEDQKRIIDLAGIKGGANTQIDQYTRKIIFQAAIFDPAHIRRTSQKLGIRTEAAVRYMHGFDHNLPPIALARALELLRETNPEAKVFQKIDIYSDPASPQKIVLDINYANKLLGTYLSIREMKQILERLGFGVKKNPLQITNYKLQITVPSHRLDINIPEDLIEEIGRIYGYENISVEPPSARLITPRRNEHVFWRARAREILAGFGFSEVYNYSLISYAAHLELANPLSDEFKHLRSVLWSGVLKNIALNQKFFSSVQIFELGKVFSAKHGGGMGAPPPYPPSSPPMGGQGGESFVRERENLAFAVSASDSNPNEFYRLKGYLDELFNKLGITDFYLDPALNDEEKQCFAFLHPARRANILLNGEKIGYIGEIHPKTRDDFDVKRRVFYAEFNFEKVSAAAEEEQIYQAPSKYPQIVRDIAVLVPREVMVDEVLNLIEIAGGPLLRDTDLFDMYEGENLPEGMKNLAFHLLFQSSERTLTSQKIDEIMAKITKTLEEKLWEVR